MKKSLVPALAVVLAAFVSSAADLERVSMVVDSSKAVTLPFVVESFRVIPANRGIHVEAVESRLRIMPSVVGEFTIVAEGGGISKEIALSVKSNLTKVLKKLRTDLDALAELDIGINEDRIAVRGMVRSPEHWRYLKSVLPNYGDGVVNYATFQPSASTLKNLRDMLKAAGFPCAGDGVAPKPGEIALRIAPDAVTVSGKLYSPEQIEQVKQIVATQTWLSQDGKGAVRCILDLGLVESLVTADIVYATVNANVGSAIGNAELPVLTATFGYIKDLVGGSEGKTAEIGAGMDATVEFLANNLNARVYHAGHVSFNNNDEKGGELHTGGSIKAKVQGIQSGSIQDINYGLTFKVKGGLVRADRVKFELDLTDSSVLDSSGDDITLTENSTKQVVTCGLGRTLVIAGSRKIAENLANKGTPYLRHIPILKWFFGKDSDSNSDERLLILVCPRVEKGDGPVQIEAPLVETTRAAHDRAAELRESKIAEPYTGWKSWLNWFTF